MTVVPGSDSSSAGGGAYTSGTAAGGAAASRVVPSLSHNTSIRDFPIEGLESLAGLSPASSLDDSSSSPPSDDDNDNGDGGKAQAAAGAVPRGLGALATEAGQAVSQFLDTDTRVSRDSFAAARVAAGSVIQAVDLVASGAYRRVFVATRPPGHHAGPRGAVPSHCFWKAPGMCSSGFWCAGLGGSGCGFDCLRPAVLTDGLDGWIPYHNGRDGP